ncbi:MAG: FkbM family methyltransferase [Alphaproteobacteria bacterium HGW-Alphaproteobacteria-2]|nr:MAG: FkbM family methyltransferase [Alphaproteobacteria bacterium HGW-Alphaproteobacteria-2]
MAHFELDGVAIDIPEAMLDQVLRRALERGTYEHAEARAVALHLAPGDRVLELGAGAGFLSVQIARRVGAANLLAVEAHPGMAAVARANLARNGCEGTEVLEGAAVPDSYAAATIVFHPASAFWASSLIPPTPDAAVAGVPVPALPFGALLERHRADVAIIDIEGGEEFLFDAPWPRCPRLAIVEIHPRRYPSSSVQRIFDAASAMGLAYCAEGSRGTVVVFQRVDE